jgi:hypothetical protein
MDEIMQVQAAVIKDGPAAPKPAVDFTNMPTLSDVDVRRAIAEAEKKGIDPNSLTVSEMADLQKETPSLTVASPRISPDQTINPNAMKLDVPDQFRGKDGEADVEKLKASTQQLDEEIQKKEKAIEKSVDDYLREYKEKQTKFRNLPNPAKLADRLQGVPAPQQPGLTDQQLREIIMNDYRVDPVGTTTNLIEAVVSKHLEPFSEEKRERALRSNVESLAKDDPRILDPNIYAAINSELETNPQFWTLPNPHRMAWLEVKERMRLGESPQRANSAQPSRPPSPILGAGAPPSAPSPSERTTPRNTLESLDIRDKKQEILGDELIRRVLERKTY